MRSLLNDIVVDCWDGKDGEPIIYHGHTLTSKIKFKDVISCINENAFKVSPYPVILSIENHCGIEQQEVMAKHMVEIFKDKLQMPISNVDKLPSPEELKGKIIIKGKRLSDQTEKLEKKVSKNELIETVKDKKSEFFTSKGVTSSSENSGKFSKFSSIDLKSQEVLDDFSIISENSDGEGKIYVPFDKIRRRRKERKVKSCSWTFKHYYAQGCQV
jgi:hypothetical protein